MVNPYVLLFTFFYPVLMKLVLFVDAYLWYAVLQLECSMTSGLLDI